MKATIITCFESNEERVEFVRETLLNKNYQVSVFTTDFSHINKEYRNNIPSFYNVVHTKKYNSNLSIDRIISHIQFSKNVFKQLEDDNDLIWLMIPANSLIKEASRYKKSHPNTKLIVDVIDMWPESLPIHLDKNIFPLNIWKNIRQKYLYCADGLVSECSMYKDILRERYDKKIDTLYWAKENKAVDKMNVDDEYLSLCYIGSINNIIDIEKISNLIKNIDKKVIVHIIGSGEKKNDLIHALNEYAKVIYHGQTFDEEEKENIFSVCHAGINIYKEGLYIGLTTKCIDYFRYGLPIINNIKGDTWSLIEEYNAGINVLNNKVDYNSLIDLRKKNNIKELYSSHFTKEAFMNKCSEIIDEVIL